MRWRSDNGTASARRAEAEAAVWLARLHADDRDRADEGGFRTWLNESDAHRGAFRKVTDAWELVGGLHAEFDDIAQPANRQESAVRESPHAKALGRAAD